MKTSEILRFKRFVFILLIFLTFLGSYGEYRYPNLWFGYLGLLFSILCFPALISIIAEEAKEELKSKLNG